MRYKKRMAILEIVEPGIKYEISKLKNDLLSGEYNEFTRSLSPGLYDQKKRLIDLEVKLNLILEHFGLEVVSMEAKTILKKK